MLLRLEDDGEAGVEELETGDLLLGHADFAAQVHEDLREQDRRGGGADEDDQAELERIAQAIEQTDGGQEEQFHGRDTGTAAGI